MIEAEIIEGYAALNIAVGFLLSGFLTGTVVGFVAGVLQYWRK